MTDDTPARRSTRRKGAAAVEFAIAISVLLLLIFASIEFVRLNMLKHAVEQASYQAARRGMIIGAKSSEVKTTALDHLSLFGLVKAKVDVVPGTIEDDTQVVEVTVNVPVKDNTWISPVYFTGTLAGRTRMLAEREAADMNAALPPPPTPAPAP